MKSNKPRTAARKISTPAKAAAKSTARAAGQPDTTEAKPPRDFTHSDTLGFIALETAHGAGFTAARYVTTISDEKPDPFTMGKVMETQVALVGAGNMERVEGALLAQALTLNTIFNDLASRAAAYRDAGRFEQFDKLLRLALKAQGQSRATLEALVEAKTPRSVAFVRQANVNAGGQMQVNNGSSGTPPPTACAGARTRGTEERREGAGNAPNGLLEDATHEQVEWVDAGTARTTGGADPVMETVGAVHRAAHR